MSTPPGPTEPGNRQPGTIPRPTGALPMETIGDPAPFFDPRNSNRGRCWFGRHAPPPPVPIKFVRAMQKAMGVGPDHHFHTVVYTCSRCGRDGIEGPVTLTL